MNNKFFLFSFPFLIGFLLLIPFAKADAYQTYVGLRVDGIYNIYNGSTEQDHKNWCLLADYTTMTIVGVPSGEVTSTQTVGTYSGCNTDTIWSNLVDLTSGATYQVELGIIRKITYPTGEIVLPTTAGSWRVWIEEKEDYCRSCQGGRQVLSYSQGTQSPANFLCTDISPSCACLHLGAPDTRLLSSVNCAMINPPTAADLLFTFSYTAP